VSAHACLLELVGVGRADPCSRSRSSRRCVRIISEPPAAILEPHAVVDEARKVSLAASFVHHGDIKSRGALAGGCFVLRGHRREVLVGRYR
jgi:hypothetical protein